MSKIGITIKIASNTKESALILLKELIEEIQNGTVSMYYPLNDNDNTQGDISVVSLNDKDLYDNWDECSTLIEGDRHGNS